MPPLAQMTFRAGVTWEEGTRSKAAIGTFTHKGAEDTSRRTGQFQLTGDEPPVLLGSNTGPNAVELCLSALGFCCAVGYVANAAAQGIAIQELSYDVEGDIDLHAFLGLPEGRPGFTAIRVRGRVKSPDATPEQLQQLCQYVQDTSPVRDILAYPVPVETDLEVIS